MTARARLALAAGLALASAAAFVFLPLAEGLQTLVERAAALGPGGAFLFMALFVPACVFALPGTPITLFCAYTYGFWPTFPAAILWSNLGAQAAFLVSRWLLADSVRRWVARRPRLAAVERALGARAFRTVFLLRLTPALPFNGLNYALGVTPIGFWAYAGATCLGMLPGTALNTYAAATAGELGRALDAQRELGPWEWGFLGARVLVALIVTVWITRTVRRVLRTETAGSA